jgi:hypothetical protein
MLVQLFSRQEKPWAVHFESLESAVIVEVQTPPLWKHFPSVYIDLLDHILQDSEVLALSQLIDERQWKEKIPNRKAYINAIRQRFSVQALITATFDKAEPPNPESSSFIIHLVGQPSHNLLTQVLGFGMNSLPHIMYGLQRIPDRWPLEVLSWNEVFVRWYRLKENDAVLVTLVEQSNLLIWTSDDNLFVALPNASELDRVLEHIKNVARRRGLRVVIERSMSS